MSMDIVLKRCAAMFLDMWIAASIPLAVLLMDQILNLPDIVIRIFAAAPVLLLLLKDLTRQKYRETAVGVADRKQQRWRFKAQTGFLIFT